MLACEHTSPQGDGPALIYALGVQKESNESRNPSSIPVREGRGLSTPDDHAVPNFARRGYRSSHPATAWQRPDTGGKFGGARESPREDSASYLPPPPAVTLHTVDRRPVLLHRKKVRVHRGAEIGFVGFLGF